MSLAIDRAEPIGNRDQKPRSGPEQDRQVLRLKEHLAPWFRRDEADQQHRAEDEVASPRAYAAHN